QGTPKDPLILAPGQSVEMDPVYVRFTRDPVIALEDYAEAIAAVVPPLTWDGDPQTGWATWYEFFADVTEKNVRDHIAALTEQGYAEAGYRGLQLDDGYQREWGDWHVNEKFPSGLDQLATDIDAAGLIPGIWIAPFLVDTDLPTFNDNPDWFLKDASGEFVLYSDAINGPKGVLDVTHPEAADFLRGVIRARVDDGFRYLKLDFLYAGAYEAVRHDPRVTALQAYNQALDLMREEAGDGVYLLASGQPMLPTVGHFHAARTSIDIVYTFYRKTLLRGSANIARYNAARAWMQPLYDLDPDNLCVRPKMTVGQAWTTTVSNALVAGNVFLGDDLTKLAPERAALLADPATLAMLDLRGPMRPLDLFDHPVDKVIWAALLDVLLRASDTAQVWYRDGVLAIVNFDKAPISRFVDVERLGLPGGSAVRLTGLDHEETREFTGKILLSAEPEQALLYRVEPLEK
ncbi:alpha-galactosidase, partial [bacterium]|nr:alpha-galactosidase [bacterium]